MRSFDWQDFVFLRCWVAISLILFNLGSIFGIVAPMVSGLYEGEEYRNRGIPVHNSFLTVSNPPPSQIIVQVCIEW